MPTLNQFLGNQTFPASALSPWACLGKNKHSVFLLPQNLESCYIFYTLDGTRDNYVITQGVSLSLEGTPNLPVFLETFGVIVISFNWTVFDFSPCGSVFQISLFSFKKHLCYFGKMYLFSLHMVF